MARKIIVSLLGASFFPAILFAIWGFTNTVPSVEQVMIFCPIGYIIGFIAFYYDQTKKEKKRLEEEERQAKEDETNRLMREYLKKKMEEEQNS